jgi:hypothetical protein
MCSLCPRAIAPSLPMDSLPALERLLVEQALLLAHELPTATADAPTARPWRTRRRPP